MPRSPRSHRRAAAHPPDVEAHIAFPGSPEPTLGIELELWVIDRATRKLVPRAPELIDAARSPSHVKPELFQSIIEITTPVCRTVGEACTELRQRITRLEKLAAARGLGLIASGTPCLSDWRDLPVSRGARYARLIERMQWPARRLLICGTHVHVGVKSGEHAIAIMNAVVVFLPHLLALSASSPFWLGRDTGLASARVKIFEGLPTAGLPPAITNWSEFIQLMRTLRAAEAIDSIREIWWDIRPHPFFGTLEIRICDATSTLAEVGAVAAFAQALVAYFQRLYDQGEPLPALRAWTIKENKWRAARWGHEAMLIRNERGEQVRLAKHVGNWIDKLESTARQLGCTDELRYGRTLLARGPGYVRQRQTLARTHRLEAVVDALHAELHPR